MSTNSLSTTAATSEDATNTAASWLPLVIIVLAQLQMGFSISALPVSIGPVSADLNAPPTAIGTALVVYSLFVAAFVMLGAKIGKLLGEKGLGPKGTAQVTLDPGFAFATDSLSFNVNVTDPKLHLFLDIDSCKVIR